MAEKILAHIHFSLTKPQSFADCIGDELPFGWEVAYDKDIGQYFIDHNTGADFYLCLENSSFFFVRRSEISPRSESAR